MVDATRYLSPNYLIEVGDRAIGDDISRLVVSLDYESSDGIADAAHITLTNPGFILTDKKVFMPGNEISIYMGYGTDLTHIGRVVITRVHPSFPQDDMPSLQVVGYTRDQAMMDNEPENPVDRRYEEVTYADVVRAVAARYSMDVDIDLIDGQLSFVHKQGMKDYELVKGLANLSGWLFWVDGDDSGKWTLHFRDPAKYLGQVKKYTFEYNAGEDTTLFGFDPEFLLMGGPTTLRVQTKVGASGELIDEELEVTDTPADTQYLGLDNESVPSAPESAEAVKIFVKDYSFQVVPNKRFADAASARRWATQWFKRMRENFILGKGKVIGLESLMARQTHALSGLGLTYDGDYYFTNVRHVITASEGYLTEFSARKVL